MSVSETSNVLEFIPPAALPEPANSDKHLRALADQVRRHSRTSSISIIAIGEALRDAKKRLEHGNFGDWVRDECGFTIRTAQTYMRIHKLADKSEKVSLLNPAALRCLARRSTPLGVVNHVLDRLDQNHVLNEAEILGLILDSQTDAEAADVPKVADDEHTLGLARELHDRLGADLVLQLIESRWPRLRKHLRDTFESSNP
jgi:hypothetical protein